MCNWITKESKNYIFHYHKDSTSETMIDQIISTQEHCFNHISKVLQTNFDDKIKYYLCNSAQEVGSFYGDDEPCNAFARKPNEIFAVVNEEVKCVGYHEDSHIISYTLSTPPQVFMREGLAMYFDKQLFGINNLNWVSYFINNNKYINISSLIVNDEFYKKPWNITYPIAGVFTDYIISVYGIDTYLKLYTLLDNNFENCFYKVFKISLEEFEIDFVKYIHSFKTNEDLFKLLEKLI
ncbi:MAG: hypothetical protein RR942_11080 [Romboutsia sp.]